MLMTPSLTSNFHPTFAGFGQEGVRHDLNRLYYGGQEVYRPDFLDAQGFGPSGYMTPGYSPIMSWGYGYGPTYGYGSFSPYTRGYDPRYSWRGYERGYDRSYDRGYDRFFDRPYDRGYDRGYERPYDRGYDRVYGGMFEPRVRSYEAPYTLQTTEAGFASEPPVNGTETPDAFLFVVELPGVDLKDVNLQIHGGMLVLNAFRRPTWSNGTVTVNYYQAEGRFGALRRVLPLPAGVIPSQIQANFVNGLLSIILPKNAPGANQVPQASIVINSAVPTNM